MSEEALYVDEPDDAGQNTKTGLVSEGELDLVRSVAKKLGWTPKEEWSRDPDKWVDADQFLENTPRQIETLKERLKRTGQAAEAAIEESRRQARLEAQAEIRAAAEAQDPERAAAAANRLAEISGPPPQTLAWINRNSWFNTDPEAQALARSVVERAAAQGRSIDEQLEEAEASVKRRFPEHFSDYRRKDENREVRLSDRRPPAVQGGSRTAAPVSKDKSFADIPAGDRALYQRHFAKRFESNGLKPEQAQAKYASAYWSNKGE